MQSVCVVSGVCLRDMCVVEFLCDEWCVSEFVPCGLYVTSVDWVVCVCVRCVHYAVCVC